MDMRLYEEIFKGVDGFDGARYTVALTGGGYFEGVKAVGDFSPEKIVLFFPKHTVEVEGRDLFIKKYCDGDLQLSGVIDSVHLLDSAEKVSAQRQGQ